MASFQSFLHVSGKKYEILYSDLDIHQKIDSLGRPWSPTFWGMFNVEMNVPGRDDPTLPDWMFDPAKTLNCKVVFKSIDTNATLKTTTFYNRNVRLSLLRGYDRPLRRHGQRIEFPAQPLHLSRTSRHQLITSVKNEDSVDCHRYADYNYATTNRKSSN